jgi:hypothetical protein
VAPVSQAVVRGSALARADAVALAAGHELKFGRQATRRRVRSSGCSDPADEGREQLRKDVREFIRRLEAAGFTVESAPGHYHFLRDDKPLRKQNGMPFTLPFSPDTIRWRTAAPVELRKLGIHL